MTTLWKITQCDRLTADGFITTAHWNATSVDGDYTASVYSTCSWSDDSPSVPYASITEAQVLAWCYASGVDKEATENALAQNIADQKAPKMAAGVPW